MRCKIPLGPNGFTKEERSIQEKRIFTAAISKIGYCAVISTKVSNSSEQIYAWKPFRKSSRFSRKSFSHKNTRSLWQLHHHLQEQGRSRSWWWIYGSGAHALHSLHQKQQYYANDEDLCSVTPAQNCGWWFHDAAPRCLWQESVHTRDKSSNFNPSLRAMHNGTSICLRSLKRYRWLWIRTFELIRSLQKYFWPSWYHFYWI